MKHEIEVDLFGVSFPLIVEYVDCAIESITIIGHFDDVDVTELLKHEDFYTVVHGELMNYLANLVD